MTLRELETKLLTLNPDDIVKVGMDNYSPYTYVELPTDMKVELTNLSPDERTLYDDFENDYLSRLETDGHSNTVKYLSNNLD